MVFDKISSITNRIAVEWGAEEQVLGAHGMEEGSLRRPWEVGMSELLDHLAAPPADNFLVGLASKS